MKKADKDTDGTLPYFVKDRIDMLLHDLGGPKPLTYQELAEKMEMDKGQLSKLVNGKQMVRLDTLQRIAKALGVPLATLFEGTRPPVSNFVELASLLTAHHQEAIRALGDLARSDGSVDARARRLGAADRRARDDRENQERSK